MREDDPQQLAQLAEPLRTRIAWLLDAAKGAVWIVSGRRTIQEQVDLRRANCGPTWYDIWQRPASQCNPPTAIPGTSRHEKGEAVDIGGDKSLARRLAAKIGLHLPVPGEDWHLELDPHAKGLLPIDFPIDDVDLGDVFPIPDVAGAVEDAIGGVLGALVDPLVKGAARIALVGVLVAGGVGLVVLGGVRGAQTRSSP